MSMLIFVTTKCNWALIKTQENFHQEAKTAGFHSQGLVTKLKYCHLMAKLHNYFLENSSYSWG